MSFDYKTAADLSAGRVVSKDKAYDFATRALWTHQDRESFISLVAKLRNEIEARDAEIQILKDSLLNCENELGDCQANLNASWDAR